MDKVSKATRSRIMSRVRSTGNKTTEARLRAYLASSRVKGWKLRPSEPDGKPDFVFEAARLAVFVDGAFWHGAPGFTRFPKSRVDYWKRKIQRNKQRDIEVTRRLRAKGWAVLRFWDYELRQNPGIVVAKIKKKVQKRSSACK